MMSTLTLKPPVVETLTEIFIEKGLLKSAVLPALLKKISPRFALITDTDVLPLYGEPLKKHLANHGISIDLFSFAAGEKAKTTQTKELIENQMLEAGFNRDCALIALGGGVVTDLAGFVAATFCRGIPFVSIPTTLLAMCDASLGGKVGVNTMQGKNLIGALHHPRMIFIDSDTLLTLPKKEWINGSAEIIKASLIVSHPLFKQLKANSLPWSESLLHEFITTSCKIKNEIVMQDPRERGLRRILNFGHTIAHAIETLSSYQISHGEAVAIGMLVKAHLTLGVDEITALTTTLKQYGFSLKLPSTLTSTHLLEAMKYDKKAHQRKPRFVLLETIGKPFSFEGNYCTSIDTARLKEIIERVVT